MPVQAEYKYIKNIDKTVATMYLYGDIGYDPSTYTGIDGYMFALEMDWLIRNYPEVKKINVRINSPGGNVIDGFSIFSAINNVNQNVKGVFVDTYNDGISASTAGWLLLAGKNVFMADFAMLMLHKPSWGNEADLTKKDKEILEKFTNSIITIFEARTGLSRDEINAMMEEETWMDSSTALEKGFVNKIISSGKSIEKPKEAGIENYWKVYNKLSAPEKTIINQPVMPTEQVTTKKKVVSLSNEMASLLGVRNHAEAVLKIQNLQGENKTVTEENKTLKTQLNEAQNKLKEQEKAKAVALVENAISQKKITNEQKETWLNLAEQNYEHTKNALDAMVAPTTQTTPKLSDLINNGKKDPQNSADDTDRENWTHLDWAKKDSKGLEKMKNEEPEKFEALKNKRKIQ